MTKSFPYETWTEGIVDPNLVVETTETEDGAIFLKVVSNPLVECSMRISSRDKWKAKLMIRDRLEDMAGQVRQEILNRAKIFELNEEEFEQTIKSYR